MESEISKKDAEKLALANNYMGLLLNNLFVKEETNVVFSPFSISIALAMLFYGARNETAEEIRNVIGYKFANVKDDKPKAYFQKFLNELDNISDSYTLTCANTVVSDKEFKVKRKYISLLEEYFKAFFQEADFNNEIAEVVKLINEWVSKKTCGMIPTFLESLDPSTVMVILNAVYFKGSWMHQFDKDKTSLQRFYNKGKNGKKVEMMHLTNDFSFVEKESFKALQLPYKGEEISMLILLPNLKNGLEKLETSLTPNFVQDLTQEMINRKVEVALPKFKLEYFKALKKFFISLGLKRPFGAAQLSISDCGGVRVTEIIHKAVIEVNEEGSEAAAATAIIMGRCLRPKPIIEKFIADHPFMFVIYNSQNNLILFMGRVNELK